MINVSLFDENTGKEESNEFENQFKELSINPEVNSSQKFNNNLSFEDHFASLMKIQNQLILHLFKSNGFICIIKTQVNH